MTGVSGHRCISAGLWAGAWGSAEWLVVAGWVEGEFAEEFAGVGVDDADVAVGDEGDESFSCVLASQADVVEPAVVADGQDAGGIGSVAAGAVVDRDRRFRRLGLGTGVPGLLGWPAADGAVGTDGVVVAPEPVELALQGGDRGRWRLGREPLLLGLVEPLDLAAGLGVGGPGGRPRGW